MKSILGGVMLVAICISTVVGLIEYTCMEILEGTLIGAFFAVMIDIIFVCGLTAIAIDIFK